MYGELDGTFPNHPADPIQPANQRDLQARVVAVGADVGLAFDGDADRVFFVDETGRGPVGLDHHRHARRRHARPGAGRARSCTTSSARGPCPRSSCEHGGVPVRTRVGHSYIKQVMAETGAAFGGEHSAHYYFRDNYRADSGIIATHGRARAAVRRPACRCRSCASRSSATPPRARSTPRSPTRGRDRAGRRGLRRRRPQDRLDGLTVDCGAWWFNLRPSNTEPLLRLNLEAPTADECDEHVAEVLALIDALTEGRTDGARPAAARDPRLPRGQGPAALLRRRGRAVQPPAAAPLP